MIKHVLKTGQTVDRIKRHKVSRSDGKVYMLLKTLNRNGGKDEKKDT